MKKNDWINRLLCLAAGVLMLCAMPVLAMAEEEALPGILSSVEAILPS